MDPSTLDQHLEIAGGQFLSEDSKLNVAGIDGQLAKDIVAFCVDTNILVEFRALDQLPWRELAPSASIIRIIIPTKVGAEMDGHKTSTGRLRKRAADFNNLAGLIERNGYAPLVLRKADPKVTVEFGPLLKARDLDGEQFELDDSDSPIVAEATKISQTVPDLIFLSDDGMPIRLAHHAGLPVLRPPKTWRRPDGSDERDQQIADLKRQLGPQPKLVLEFSGATGGNAFQLQHPPESICPNCIERVVRSILTSFPETHRRVLEGRYPSAFDGGLFAMRFPSRPGEVTVEHLDNYRSDYKEFATQVHAWARGLPLLLGRRGPTTIVRLVSENTGDRAAEKVHLEVSLAGPFRFIALDDFQNLGNGFLEPHDEPVPFGPLPALSQRLQSGNEKRADRFYEQDVPSTTGGRTTSIS